MAWPYEEFECPLCRALAPLQPHVVSSRRLELNGEHWLALPERSHQPRGGALAKLPGMVEQTGWLVLVYRVPREPSRLRAAVWRRLKALGAVYLQGGVAALPALPEEQRALRLLRNDITEMGGSAQLIEGRALAGETQLVDAFNAARDEEYAEVIGRCEDFLEEIKTETAAAHFTYAELEENDEDLTKLRTWLAKVAARDHFGAARGMRAAEALEQATSALHRFAEMVYEAETEEEARDTELS